MYTHTHTITTNIGNNTFSYNERMQALGKAEITLPILKTITDYQDITLGEHIVLEEMDHKGKLHSCTGLRYIYRYKPISNPSGQGETPKAGRVGKSTITKNTLSGGSVSKDIYLMDNHNHALYFWGTHRFETQQSLPVIHIDQHADLGKPLQNFDMIQFAQKGLQYLRDYTNHHCTIGSFIPPALDAGIIGECRQIRSEYALLALGEKLPRSNQQTKTDINMNPVDTAAIPKDFILDIDLDFRAPQMSIEKYNQTISITRQLMAHAQLVTIATSPFFIDQHDALNLLHSLLA